MVESELILTYSTREYIIEMNQCRKTPYPWSAAALARSPFRTRKQVRTKGFSAISSLKSMGRLPRSNGCYVIGQKYKNLFSRRRKQS